SCDIDVAVGKISVDQPRQPQAFVVALAPRSRSKGEQIASNEGTERERQGAMAKRSPVLLRQQPVERHDEEDRHERKRNAEAMKRRRWNRQDHPSKERDQHDRIDHQPFRAAAHMNDTDSRTENEERETESIEQ